MEKYRLAYFLTIFFEQQYLGGVMVTDNSGIPLEFKYSDPIKPTRLHQILFGKVLSRYIKEEVIKKNIFREIKSGPAIILVNDPELLAPDPALRIPLICLQNSNLPNLAQIGEIQRVKEKEILIQTASISAPLRVLFPTPEPDYQERILAILKSFTHDLDLLEPFNRVDEALRAICQNPK